MTKLEIDFLNSLTGEPLSLVADITYRLPKIASFIERRELSILKNITDNSYLYADMNNLDKVKSILDMGESEAIGFCDRNNIEPYEYIIS